MKSIDYITAGARDDCDNTTQGGGGPGLSNPPQTGIDERPPSEDGNHPQKKRKRKGTGRKGPPKATKKGKKVVNGGEGSNQPGQ